MAVGGDGVLITYKSTAMAKSDAERVTRVGRYKAHADLMEFVLGGEKK